MTPSLRRPRILAAVRAVPLHTRASIATDPQTLDGMIQKRTQHAVTERIGSWRRRLWNSLKTPYASLNWRYSKPKRRVLITNGRC